MDMTLHKISMKKAKEQKVFEKKLYIGIEQDHVIFEFKNQKINGK